MLRATVFKIHTFVILLCIVGTKGSSLVSFAHPGVIGNSKYPLGRRDSPETQCPAPQKLCDQPNYCAEVCCGYGYGGMYLLYVSVDSSSLLDEISCGFTSLTFTSQ